MPPEDCGDVITAPDRGAIGDGLTTVIVHDVACQAGHVHATGWRGVDVDPLCRIGRVEEAWHKLQEDKVEQLSRIGLANGPEGESFPFSGSRRGRHFSELVQES